MSVSPIGTINILAAVSLIIHKDSITRRITIDFVVSLRAIVHLLVPIVIYYLEKSQFDRRE